MSFTFQIQFAFLCAFTPDRPFGQDNQPINCRVLLRDLRNPQILDDLVAPPGSGCKKVRKHEPVLVFRDTDVDQAHTDAALLQGRDRVAKSNNLRTAIRFRGENLHLAFDGPDPVTGRLEPDFQTPSRGTSETTNPDEVPDLSAPIGDERKSLYWLGDPKRWGQRIDVHPDFQTGGGPAGAPLAGRVHLGDGTLAIHEEGLSSRIWMVIDEDEEVLHQQFLGLVIEYERLSVADFVELQFRKFGAAPGGAPSTLRLRPTGDASRVVIHIRNCEWDRIFGSVPPDYKRRDCDYRLYYRLAGNAAGGRIWRPETENHNGNGPCSPSATNGP